MEQMRVVRLILAENLTTLQDEINKFFIMYSGTDPHVVELSSDFDCETGELFYFACVEYNVQKTETK